MMTDVNNDLIRYKFPDNFWDVSDEIRIISPLTAPAPVDMTPFSTDEFSTNEYAKRHGISRRTARKRVQTMREEGVIKMHRHARTRYGIVPYYVQEDNKNISSRKKKSSP